MSEDGTIAVTNLNSGEIHRLVHNYSAMSRKERGGEKGRIDAFMEERGKDKALKRRHSFCQCFSVNQYYQMVKVKSQRIVQYTTFSRIDKVLEVKDIQTEIQDKLNKKEEGSTTATSTTSTTTPTYACVSTDGVVFLMHITNLHVDVSKLTGMDSDIVGVYANE